MVACLLTKAKINPNDTDEKVLVSHMLHVILLCVSDLDDVSLQPHL